MYVDGKYVYVTCWTAGVLDIFNVSDPYNPVKISAYPLGSTTEPSGVSVSGDIKVAGSSLQYIAGTASV